MPTICTSTTTSADTSTATGTVTFISYDAAVSEGKQIVAKLEVAQRGQLRLGELADKLEPKYGDRTMAKYANELGISKCTLDRYRTVWRAWEGKLAPGPNSIPSYAVCRELAKHDKREAIVRENPAITKSEARKLMRDYKHDEKENASLKQTAEQAEAAWLQETRKWFRDLCVIANKANRAADFVDGCTFKQQQRLLQVVEFDLLKDVRKGGDGLHKVCDCLQELLEEAEADEEHHAEADEREDGAEADEAKAPAHRANGKEHPAQVGDE